jgi:hypothetical protein
MWLIGSKFVVVGIGSSKHIEWLHATRDHATGAVVSRHLDEVSVVIIQPEALLTTGGAERVCGEWIVVEGGGDVTTCSS